MYTFWSHIRYIILSATHKINWEVKRYVWWNVFLLLPAHVYSLSHHSQLSCSQLNVPLFVFPQCGHLSQLSISGFYKAKILGKYWLWTHFHISTIPHLPFGHESSSLYFHFTTIGTLFLHFPYLLSFHQPWQYLAQSVHCVPILHCL